MKLIERVAAERKNVTLGGGQGFTQPPFWSLDQYRSGMWSYSQPDRERIENDFAGFVAGAYKADGIVFACVQTRQLVFSEARFQWQAPRGGRPGPLFGTLDLSLIERPWPGGTTSDLLARMEVDLSLAGNFYATVADDAGRLGRAATGPGRRVSQLRPDWVTIIVSSASGDPRAADAHPVGYLYEPPPPSGQGSRSDPVVLMPGEVCHYAGLTPDPLARFRGMSWLTSVLKEISSDRAATTHKYRFFENGAALSTLVSFDKEVGVDAFDRFVDKFNQEHKGTDNAYKPLFLGAGATATVVGADLRQLDFKAVQGAIEPLAVDTPIPTPGGWTTMGEINVGDQVFGRDGLPATVSAVAPIHLGRDCYKVTFNDRTSVVADADHVWAAMDRNTKRRAERHYTTVELSNLIADWGSRGDQANRIAIAPARAAKLPDRDLLIDPYVLGAWLGDGQTAGAAICGAPDDLAVIADEVERRGYTTTRWKVQPDRVPVIGVPGGLLSALDALGVLGDKRIPDEYLRAGYEQRLDLLRGLMDTDGTVGHVGKESCSFSSKWEHLARQVADLVRSLGQRATLCYRDDARSRTGGTWTVQFRADPEAVPFLLPRKAERCRTPLHVRNRAIVSIEPVPSVPVRCIAVDTPDHLFCAGEGWVLTHNTRIAAASGVGAVVAQFSEGMQGSSLNSGNYSAARRRAGDALFRPLWGSAASSLQMLLTPPSDSANLAPDLRDVAFLREDAKDQAEIQGRESQTIRTLVDAGYMPESVVDAVTSGDWSRLRHSGLYSVQLQPPGGSAPTVETPTNGDRPALPVGSN